jgi:hypothetical protein
MLQLHVLSSLHQCTAGCVGMLYISIQLALWLSRRLCLTMQSSGLQVVVPPAWGAEWGSCWTDVRVLPVVAQHSYAPLCCHRIQPCVSADSVRVLCAGGCGVAGCQRVLDGVAGLPGGVRGTTRSPQNSGGCSWSLTGMLPRMECWDGV